MRKLLPVCLLASLFASCSSDPTIDKTRFPMEAATAVCRWYFSCCDSAERPNLALKATTESACVAELTATYTTTYSSADARQWDSKAAQTCVDQIMTYSTPQSPTFCKRGFDPDSTMVACPLVFASKRPGDPCSSPWECSTKFCRMGGGVGTCANPLPAGSTCSASDPCEGTLRCVNSVCKALQPDGASCTIGTECISGACGGGQCVVSQTYTCDGR